MNKKRIEKCTKQTKEVVEFKIICTNYKKIWRMDGYCGTIG